MNKTKPEKTKKPAPVSEAPPDGGWRETVESIAMAVVLALLFRGFVAEAFVIPTGSMAPTLDGRHKDLKCPQCGKWYQTSASEEQIDEKLTGKHVASATCPICRYTQTIDPVGKPNQGSFSGDRIIVGKFAYDFAEPKRWDVIVFKYPGNAVQNYIKRLIGLPGEKLWVVGGNIYSCGKDESDDALRIARKPPAKLNTLLQIVDDTDFIPQQLIDLGWPSRWQNWPVAATKPAWEPLNGGRAFVCDGSQSGDAWIRYRHLAPSHSDWKQIELEKSLPADLAERKGQLITDFYAYNAWSVIHHSDTLPFIRSLMLPGYQPPTQIPQEPGPGEPPDRPEAFSQHWVDDLAMECLAEVKGNQGELMMMLVRGGVKHLCRFDLASGKATLSIVDPDGRLIPFTGDDGKTAEVAIAETRVKGPGKYRLRLSNCDHEMLLWVNGSVVKFDVPTTYNSDDLIAPWFSAADPGDLAPAGVGSAGASVKLSQLRIYRDKYYIASDNDVFDEVVHQNDTNDYSKRVVLPGRSGTSETEALRYIFADPDLWQPAGIFEPGNRRHVQFVLEQDQFMPMGDNSPQSYDARFWSFRDDYSQPEHHYVERDLLIGKALLIYWPHTWNRPIPFWPNFSRMGPIR